MILASSLTSGKLFIPTFSSAKMLDEAHFNALYDCYDNKGGKEEFLYHLLYDVHISGLNPQKVPQTRGLRCQYSQQRSEFGLNLAV